MKKTTILAGLLAIFTACSKDAPIDEGGRIITPGNGLTILGSAADDSSRTAFADGESGFVLNWIAGEDGIGLYMRAGETRHDNLLYTADRSESTTTFTAAGDAAQWVDESTAHDFYAYYPYREGSWEPTAVPISVPARQTQTRAGDTEHLAELDFLYATSEGIRKTDDGTVQLQFRHPLSILEFGISAETNVSDVTAVILRCTDEEEILSAEGAAIDLTTGAVDYSAAAVSNEIVLQLAEPESFAEGEAAKRFFAQITPGHAGKQLQVIAVSGGQEILLGTKFVPASGIPAGRKAKINFGVSAKVRLSDNGTANCYIVNQPATQYLFNATVKGNGKAARYEWTDGSGNTRTHAVSAADIAVKPRSAKLLWTTNSATETVIENVAYDSATGMVSFETPSVFIDGNAVIAVYASEDGTGDVLWSWHIWAVENYDIDSRAFPAGDTPLSIMDRNLGALQGGRIDDDQNACWAVGMTYQWGRKDPFPGLGGGNSHMSWGDGGQGGAGTIAYSPDGSIAYATLYGNEQVPNKVYNYNDYGAVGTNGMQPVSAADYTNDIEGALAQSVKEPWRYHIDPNNENIPYVGTTDDPDDCAWLWGNPTGDPSGGEKSIYDPCPAGWKVAPTGVFTSLASLDRINGTYGAYLGGNYFYARGGLRTESTGYFTSVASEGNLWSDSRAVRFLMNDSGINPTDRRNPAWGIPVRCVSDRPVDLYANAEDLSAEGTANTYVVNRAGTLYKFKATVKGNGNNPLSTGETALAPAGARILWAQQQIISPTNSWPSNNGSDATLSSTILKNSVVLKDGYIYFRTNDRMENANVFIAATDADNNVLWSWHLWCVEGWTPDATAQTVTTKGINSTMLDRNLGAFGNPAAVAEPTYQDYVSARGLYYQWGRKDPFPGFRNTSGYNSSITWTEADGTVTSHATWMMLGSDNIKTDAWATRFDKRVYDLELETLDETLAYIAANPMVFISVDTFNSNTSWNWTQNSKPGIPGTEAEWGKLWGNQKNDGTGTKSMYDPCPAGYKVPSPDQLRFVTAHDENIGSTYLQDAPWKANCREAIFDAAGNNVSNYSAEGNPFLNEPYGLNFYIHGTKSKLTEGDPGYDPAAKNVGKAPEDATVSYFPHQGVLVPQGLNYANEAIFGINWYQDSAQILIQTNAPYNTDSYDGMVYRMWASNDGNFWYSSSRGHWAERIGTGVPVRCVKE